MKRLMLLEILVLILILIGTIIGAVLVCAGNPEPAPETEPVSAGTVTNPGESSVTETTEPEPTWMQFPADRALKAQQYFVYDCEQDRFLKKSGADSEKIYPASITKLFTAYMAMQYLEPDTEITAGAALDKVVWGSSVADIRKGDVLTADRLVEAMLLPSGNDAAYLLAAEAGLKIGGSGSVDSALAAFMKEMNRKAKELGMTGTHFVNPDGIHDQAHYTTFHDLVILGKMALDNPTVLKNAKTSLDKVTLKSGEKEWHNTNALIDETTPYYCPYALGLKTGQTPYAGSCLLSAFRKDGRTLLIGVFGCPEEADRFEDTLQLFNEAIGLK